LKTILRLSSLLLGITLIVSACGYHNPYVYNGPEKVLYVTHWKNRTNVLQLDTRIYQSLARWFQKTNSIKVTNSKTGADLILAGEIISVQLPSLSYSAIDAASQVKVMLTVRYVLKETKSDKVLLEVPNETWREDSMVTSNTELSTNNEEAALVAIIDNLSEKIYMRALDRLSTTTQN
jgi:hypothetical protein